MGRHGARHNVRKKSSLPKKGSRSRLILALCMRPQGFCYNTEYSLLGLTSFNKLKNNGNISGVLETLWIYKGWDIRSFRNGHEGCYTVTYKCVGYQFPNGRYRDFTNNIS